MQVFAIQFTENSEASVWEYCIQNVKYVCYTHWNDDFPSLISIPQVHNTLTQVTGDIGSQNLINKGYM